MEKNAAYVDWKFRRIKSVSPSVRCVALAEVTQAGVERVKEYVGPVMEHADVACYTMGELSSFVRGLTR